MAPAGLPGRPLYLARQNYRRRRMMDLARLLPLLATGLVLLPLLWLPATGAINTVATKIYLFALWFVLIVAAAILSRVLPVDDDGQHGDGARGDGARGDGGRAP
ncbi:hypothetical protein [Halodurantibacterium flavum]|uniref:DUF3311 domain-containing protein n=1 Tax=Halodurantibacterium flavum TaxID=1382802 RepID=A0ABW4S9N9_9RHOB